MLVLKLLFPDDADGDIWICSEEGTRAGPGWYLSKSDFLCRSPTISCLCGVFCIIKNSFRLIICSVSMASFFYTLSSLFGSLLSQIDHHISHFSNMKRGGEIPSVFCLINKSSAIFYVEALKCQTKTTLCGQGPGRLRSLLRFKNV